MCLTILLTHWSGQVLHPTLGPLGVPSPLSFRAHLRGARGQPPSIPSRQLIPGLSKLGPHSPPQLVKGIPAPPYSRGYELVEVGGPGHL